MIRFATLADIPAIVEMARELARESPKYSQHGFNADKTRALAERLTTAPAGACMLVAERAGQVIGMMALAVVERFISDGAFVTDVTLFIRPEHRGGFAFARLVDAAEKWARDQGVQDVCFGVSTQVHAERTVCAYQRKGYTLSGYTLTKTLAHGD